MWGMNEIGGNDLARFEDIYATDSAIYQIGDHSNIAILGPFAFTGFGSNEILMGKLGNPGMGIEDQLSSDLMQIYPNPAGDVIYITTNEFNQVRILNVLGETVYERTDLPKYTTTPIDISKLSKGIYVIVARNLSSTFIKQ